MVETQNALVNKPEIPRQNLPWPALVAALIAIVTLAMSLGFSLFLPIFGLALVISYFIPARISASWLHWLIRIAIYGTIVALNLNSLGAGQGLVIDSSTIQTVGIFCLAELVLQCWIKQRDKSSLGVVIFLSGLVFLLGCTTWEYMPIRFLAPAYMFFAILSLPCFRSVSSSTSAPWRKRIILRGLALLVALLAGASVYGSFWTYRQQLTDFGDRLMQNKRIPEQAGVSANPVLGDSFGSPGSPARVLRIVGPISDDHLRGLAFDTYDLGAWHGGLYRSYIRATPQDLRAHAAGPTAQITCLADSVGVIYLPLNSAGLDTGVGNAIVTWSPESGAGIRTTAPPPYSYTVVAGHSEFAQGPLCAPPPPIFRKLDLAVPMSVDPGVRALALRIGGKLATPDEKIQAVTNYLMSHYTYSLTIHPGPGDPVSNFLLHKKSAYCEYFASAATILLRCLGVPTRYVVGYYAHESDGPNVTVVRQWDAHAWAESWVDGLGWVTVDATPANGRPDNQAVPAWTRAWEWLQDESAALRAWLSQLGPARTAALVGAIGLAALFISWLWRRGWRSWMRRRAKKAVFGYTAHDRDLERMVARFEAFLSQSGLTCRTDQTWRECLERARREEPPARVSIDLEAALSFIDEYNSARFGEAGDAAGLSEKLELMEGTRR